MKLFAFLAAGLVATAGLAPTAASAQHHRGPIHHHVVRHRPHYRPHHRVCRTVWFHHHRVRRCR